MSDSDVDVHVVASHVVDAQVVDIDEASTNQLDPLVPRPIDRPTILPPGGEVDPSVGDIAKVFAAPSDPSEWPAWRADLGRWRQEARDRLDYRGDAYDAPETRWASTCYSVAQIWLWDERLFDRSSGCFTINRFLELTSKHGGFDGIVLWHAYPIIGIDDRNQWDFYRDVPGLSELIADFRSRGIRIFVDYNPWDSGTRRTGRDDSVELSALVSELGVDGVFLDTMKEGDSALVDALRSPDPPMVLEGESRVPNSRIEDHQLSWAQWFADSDAPGVMRAHWFERRHMMHGTRRWNRDHSSELQAAWMNGTGILVWDAVFGVWVGWNERDLATHRAMLRVQREFSAVFRDGDWVPLEGASADAVANGVYASRWTLDGVTLWTLVNRRADAWAGQALDTPAAGGTTRFDLVAGTQVADGLIEVPGRGVAAVLETPDASSASLLALLAEAARDQATAQTTSDDFPGREARRVVPAASAGSVLGGAVPEGAVPESAVHVEPGDYDLPQTYRRRETGWYQGAPYVEEWKPLPPRLHDERRETVRIRLSPVAVATREVTEAEWAGYVETLGAEDFTGGPRHGLSTERPVTGITLDQARAYARWCGARLPTEFEWQVAAGDAHFERAEPLVWNWTESEHTDGITRFSMLKGGSAYRAVGSDWYADGGPREPSFSLKYLHAGLGLEASPNIGFRLAWDVTGDGTGHPDGESQ